MGPAFAGTTKEGSSNGQTVIASEAKQSISRQRKYGLLRRFRLRSLSYGGRAAPRNDVAPIPDTTSPSRREAPESLHLSLAQERAWGTPGARCTRSLVCALHW